MAGITGRGTTFDLPNYVGELFQLTPADTPFLSAIGGLTGGIDANGTIYHTWQTEDLRSGSSTRQRTEGADAQTAEARVRGSAFNVLEIHQETVDVSYTKQAAAQLIDALTTGNGSGGATGGARNPVTDELTHQINSAIKSKALDIETTFLNGTFNDPSDNNTARRTRGLREAIVTNVVDCNDGDITTEGYLKDKVLDLMQEVWENGGIMEDETRTLICNAAIKRQLTAEFVTNAGYAEGSRTVGGVHVSTIETDFGNVNIMLNRHMPTDELVVCSLEECAPVFLPIPGKGHFFIEPLAKVGASERAQLYGEIGLKYGNEKKHGKIIDMGGYES
jgi:hypothetical protein